MQVLTIGMPLYRNAATLKRAVESLQAQSFRDFRVIMSDDVSPDDTVEVAERLIAGDERFTLVRQPRNLNYGNFRWLLNQAETEFFMWAAGDDWWQPTYVERCLEALRDPAVVLAVSKVEFFEGEESRGISKGTVPLRGSAAERFIRYLDDRDDNCRMYGIFRTREAKECFPKTDHHGYDLTFSALLTLYGDHVEIPEVLMGRDYTDSTKYQTYVRRDAQKWIERYMPQYGMVECLLSDPRVRKIKGAKRRLLASLLNTHLLYVKRFHPRYSRIAQPLLFQIVWRLWVSIERSKATSGMP